MNHLKWSLSRANQVIGHYGYRLIHREITGSHCAQRAYEFAESSNSVLFPICLNNGYYNAKRIQVMMLYLPEFCRSAIIFFTDGPARNNYLAVGKSQMEAEREARLQRNRLRNHSLAGLEKVRDDQFSYQFDDWQKVYQNSYYQQAYQDIHRLYHQNRELREDILKDTCRVLSRISQTNDIDEARIDTAVDYVIEELAYILSVPKRFRLERIIYIYYDRWLVLEKLLDGKYDQTIRENIAYLMLTLEKTGEGPTQQIYQHH